MAIVHLSDMLKHAQQHNYAVGAFGVPNLQFVEGVIQAAENCRSPVILNLLESHFSHYDFELLIPSVRTAAQRASIPVAVNFDHGAGIASAQRGIRAGCNGVMVDTSSLPFSDNLWQTREVAALAHSCGVTVEGELGYVPGVEGESALNHPGELSYTSAAEAAGYVERTVVDCLAVSIGTVHGRMKGAPKLDYARLDKIREAVAVPLAIHGGTGLSDEQFRRLIAHGIAKINYYTALADAANRSIRENVGADKKCDHTLLLTGARNAVREETERCLRLWGCGGRAAEVLAQCRPWQEVRHIALFNTPATSVKNDIVAVLREAGETLQTLDGVREIRIGRALQPDGQYRHCLQAILASQTALKTFLDHPLYQRYASQLLRPVTADWLMQDFGEC